MLETAIAILLASLRLAPTIAFAPPFTMVRMPGLARGCLTIALAAGAMGLGAGRGVTGWQGNLVTAAASELALGLALALSLQLAFAMIAMAGRALDIQAGFGLAFLIDPTTKAQVPLIASLFSYAAAAIFFATEGPYDVFAALAASFDALPLGAAASPDTVGQTLSFLGTVSILALGVVGLASTVLFLIDLVIAMLARTLPQMNMLVLGFQVKAMVTLLLLPATLALAAGVIARILRLGIEAMARVA
ncbi:MAG: type III secretion protein [Novosphingobium sp.]|nr:type III secretion protein [Novosphingobium sp.]MBX9644742.1 flagellar biosynthetic protein FliR [Novosphingobium sp.]